MVQILKEEIRNKILQAAVEEFYQNGFQNAKIRDIAERAGIPAGLVYSYFRNKAALFETVVEPVYEMIYKMTEKEEPEVDRPFDNFFLNETKTLLQILKSHRKQFIILIDRSSGTKYEKSLNEIIHHTQIHTRARLNTLRKDPKEDLDDDFFHILANNFVEGFIEIARHYKNEAWAQKMVNLLGRHFFYGVNSFL